MSAMNQFHEMHLAIQEYLHRLLPQTMFITDEKAAEKEWKRM